MLTERSIKNNGEQVILLKNAKEGNVIRFANDSFDEAMTEKLFYVVCKNKDKRVKLFNLSNAEIIERDEDWKVIEHRAKLSIEEN